MTYNDSSGLFWEREDTHWPDPLSKWADELSMRRNSRGIAELCAEFGLLLDGIEMRNIDGWAYVGAIPLGGKVRKPPPALVARLAVHIVPELRRRIAAARRARSTGVYTKIVDDWLGGEEDRLLTKGRGFLSDDVSTLSDEAFLQRNDEVWNHADAAQKHHFRLHAAGIMEIFTLAYEACEEKGYPIAKFAGLLTGLSATSTGPAADQQRIVDALAEADALDVLADAKHLDELMVVSAEVAAAITDYLYVWGVRAIRYEPAYPTVGERPDWLLHTLQGQVHRTADPARAERQTHGRETVEAELRDLFGNPPDFTDRVRRAQRAFPIREGNEAATVAIPYGVVRRMGLEFGRRLAARSVLHDAAHVFDLEPEVCSQALRGAAPNQAGLADLARLRFDQRRAPTSNPPASYGSPIDPPELEGFPDDVRRDVKVVLYFASLASSLDAQTQRDEKQRQTPTSATVSSTELSGLGVAPGIVEGTARVVLDESGFESIEPGDILVCPITSPIWSLVFPLLSGLVCDAGGAMSHPAIIAREFAIPAVVGASAATSTIPNGARIRLDGNEGTITVL